MAEITAPSLDDDHDDWLVYADALQSAGDARGELIVLNVAVADGSSPADRDAYLERNAKAIYGSLAAHRGAVEIEWAYCVPESLTLNVGPDDSPAKLMTALLSSPLGQAMQGLRIVAKTPSPSSRVNLEAALNQLAKGLPRCCASLELIDERASEATSLSSGDYDPGPNLVEFGNLNSVWRIAHLERLHLVVADPHQVQLGTIRAPALRDFALLGLRWAESYGGPTSMSEALEKADMPKLERLELRLPETFTYSWPDQYGAYVPVDRYADEPAYEDYYDDEGWSETANWSAELGGVLRKLHDTPIERLTLTSFSSGRALLEALEAHGLPPTLLELDLSESDLNDDDATWIAAHAGVFAALEHLDLSDTSISDAAILQELGPTVEHSEGSGAQYRFSVGME